MIMSTAETALFFIGSYSEPGPYFEANGEGLSSCLLDMNSGDIKQIHLCKEAVNATFLAKIPKSDILFVASDMYFSAGDVHTFSISPEGKLTQRSTASAHGQATCHVSIDDDASRAYVASYQDGRLTVHPVEADEVKAASHNYQYQGKSINEERQEAAHAHQAVVSPDGRWLYVCDLGSDKLWIHDLDNLEAHVDDVASVDVPAGYGPRHLICHPTLPRLYLLCELSPSLLVYDRNTENGHLKQVAEVPSVAAANRGSSDGAAIKLHPSGKTLYASHRGQYNSISVFTVDETSGDIHYTSSFSTQGEGPRDFEIDPSGRWLVVAHQNSNTVIPFELDSQTGLPTGESAQVFAFGSPVCIVFN
jgi:6-phosphogluconolactonase